MLAIASLLDPTTDQQTRDFWHALEEKCGLSGIKTAPYPHFSWLGCEDLEWPRVDSLLKKAVVKIPGFKVHSAGLGIFSGKMPILYLSLVKTQALMEIHQLIWKKIEPYLINPNDYYRPEQWMPHITIASGDLDADRLACAVRDLAYETVALDIFINNISVMYASNEGIGIKAVYKLE